MVISTEQVSQVLLIWVQSTMQLYKRPQILNIHNLKKKKDITKEVSL